MLNFPLSSKVIRQEDYIKVKDIKPGVVILMKLRKTGELFVFQTRNDKTDRQNFAQILQKIYHIYIPTILHLSGFILSPHRIICTKYMQNGSLSQFLDFKTNPKNLSKSLSPTEKSIIIHGIASTFEYLHSKNILQSPFDPSDVILSDQFYPLVQLCSISQKIKKSNSRFFAPEYLSKGEYSEKVDVFVFGVILYELATSTEFQSIKAIKSKKDKMSNLANQIVSECCNENPQQRPTFNSIIKKLKNYQDPLFIGEDQTTISAYDTRNHSYNKMNNYTLSKKYRDGNELPKDLGMAAYLMKKAADEEYDPRAQFSYGKMLSNGAGVTKNMTESKQYLEKSSQKGYEKATKQLEVLKRRENLEWPMIFQSQLFNLTISTHKEAVEMVVNADEEKQEIAAYTFFTMLKIKPFMQQKYIRVICDICKTCKTFYETILEAAFSNLNCFSIPFIYYLYKKNIFPIQDFIVLLTENEIDDYDILTLILSWFGPEIGSVDAELLNDYIQDVDFNYNEIDIKFKRSIKHPTNHILQIIQRDNPSEFGNLTHDNFNFQIPIDYYDPVSISLKGQTPSDYAAFLSCYHIFSKIVTPEDFSPSLMKNAIHGGSIEILNHLKEMHADFSDSLKNSVLFHQQHVIDWILTNNLDYWSKDLILYAAASNYVQFLIDYRCDPYFKDEAGNSAIHIASRYGSVDFLRVLFAFYDDLDVNEANYKGMTPIQFAYDNGQKLVISFIRDLAGIDDSNSNSFSEYAKFSGNFFIKNKKADVSDDDDFLKLEDEANKDSGEEIFEDIEDNQKASDLESFDPSNEKKRLKYGNAFDQQKVYYSSEENSDFERDTSYMSNYIKSLLSVDLFNEFKNAQIKGIPQFKMIEVPDSTKRPFQITKDYSDLILDLMNELIESDDLKDVEYEDYIEKLSSMFLTENHDDHHKPKEESHKVVIDAYKDAFNKYCGLECAEFVFERSDLILKEQLSYAIGLGCERPPENSELETVVINFAENKKEKIMNDEVVKKIATKSLSSNSSPLKNQMAKQIQQFILSSPVSPKNENKPKQTLSNQQEEQPIPKPIQELFDDDPKQKQIDYEEEHFSTNQTPDDSLLESPNHSQSNSLFESTDQSLFESPIESPIESPNHSAFDDQQVYQGDYSMSQNASYETIDPKQLEDKIRSIMPESLFNQNVEKILEGKIPDMIPNETENDDLIDAINLYATMDNLSEYTYDQYIKHLVNAYLNGNEEEEEEIEFASDDNNN